MATGIEQLASGPRLTLSRGKTKRDTEDAGDQQDRIEEEKVDPDVDLGCEDLEGELPQRVASQTIAATSTMARPERRHNQKSMPATTRAIIAISMWRPYHQSYQRRTRSGWRRAGSAQSAVPIRATPSRAAAGSRNWSSVWALEAGSQFIIDLRQSPSPD